MANTRRPFYCRRGLARLAFVTCFVLGTFLTRSAGCVENDIADRKFDPFVERTQDRPLAQGVITVRAALLWMGVLLGLAAILVLTTNVLTIVLAAVGACFAGLYPFM